MRSVRAGAKLRKLVDAARLSKKKRYECPTCGKKKMRNRSYAVWKCNSCGAVYAGGAYSLYTEVGEIALRMMHSGIKSF